MSFYETDTGVWGGSAPGSGPFASQETLGFWFELAAPHVLAGFSRYSDGRHPNFVLFQLWDIAATLVATQVASAPETNRTPAGAGWRNYWLKPRTVLAPATPYLLSASVSEFWANFGALVAAPLVVGDITVYQNGTSPGAGAGNGQYDAVTDAGGLFNFLNPPHDPTVGHLYGIDLLLK